MSISLPNKSKCGAKTAKVVHKKLTSVIAYRPNVKKNYTFYEVVDKWLGPWGDKGYPIGYGKFYLIAFQSNKKLMNDPVTKQWLKRTMVLLQEKLRDYLVDRVHKCTIQKITEKELRAAAFESHSQAYIQADLTKVIFNAPELIPIILAIPIKEFNPVGENFWATIEETFETVIGLGIEWIDYVLYILKVDVTYIAPRYLYMTKAPISQTLRSHQRWADKATKLRKLLYEIEEGYRDHPLWLNRIIHKLAPHTISNFERLSHPYIAKKIYNAAIKRKKKLFAYYEGLYTKHPVAMTIVRQNYPYTYS